MTGLLGEQISSTDQAVINSVERKREGRAVGARSLEGSINLPNKPSSGLLHEMMEQVKRSMQTVIPLLPERFLR